MGRPFHNSHAVSISHRHFGSKVQIAFRSKAVRRYSQVTFVHVASSVFLKDFRFANCLPFRTDQRATSSPTARAAIRSLFSRQFKHRLNRNSAWDCVAVSNSVFICVFKVSGAAVPRDGTRLLLMGVSVLKVQCLLIDFKVSV